MRKIIFILLFISIGLSLSARVPRKRILVDSLGNPIKTDWNFGVIPGIAYDIDKGWTFGLCANIFDYDDGSYYPNYRHYVYLEGSISTKGVRTYRLFYESDSVVKNHKLLIDFSYLPEAKNDFYGFNGDQSVFNYDWMNENSPNCLNRAFYTHESNLFRCAFDIRGNIVRNFYWYAGLGSLEYKISRTHLWGSYDAENQNELYNLYVHWGLISEKEKNGGWHPYGRFGLGYDSRNQRVNTIRGIYIDAFVTYNTECDGNISFNSMKFNFDFSAFHPIIGKRMVFCYRVASQNTILGQSPYYLDSYLNVLYLDHNRYYGLGGATSLRGVMRNRIWVPGYAFSTVEMRSRIWHFDVGRQHFYFGMNVFLDAGMVTQKYDIDEQKLREAFDADLADPESWISVNNKKFDEFFDFSADVYKPHFGFGSGVKLAMNENFVLSCEWAMPFSKQDNFTAANFYLGMGFMF